MGEQAKNQAGGRQSLKPGFSSLVLSIASAALFKMEPEALQAEALKPDRKTGRKSGGLSPEIGGKKIAASDLRLARYNIDLLDLLREKTKGRLTKEESRLLESCEKDLQLKFAMLPEAAKPLSADEGKDLKPNFSSLVLSIASAALLEIEPKMGRKAGLSPEKNMRETAREIGTETGETGGASDLRLARYNIDLLDLLREKTKGRLTKEESRLLESCGKDLQLKFALAQSGLGAG